MELVYIVMLLALFEYQFLGALVGRARMEHQVKAPATTGPEPFERVYRTHQNTLESLIVFVPSIWIFGLYVSPLWGAIVGVLFIVGRAVYARAYIGAAEKRGPGALITALANAILGLGALIGIVVSML